MNQKQKIIVSITGIFIVLLALVGLTYAYFLTQIRGNEETKSISVTTANLILEYSDGHGSVSLDNIVAGESGFAKTTKTFAVINRGNETIENYNVYLENVINQFEIKEDLRYKLTCRQVKTEDYEHYINELKSEDFSDVVEEVGSCNGKSRTTFPSVMSVIGTNTIDPGYTQYYELEVQYLFQNYDQSIDMNKQVSAKVNIYDGKTKFLSTEIINNTTLNKTNNSTTGTLYTLPNALPTKIAEEISGSDERILSYTLDDLGTSYYYRGNVNDNYVNFAGMCWRVVRIEGDGSVKLILEDQDQLCNSVGEDGNNNLDRNWALTSDDGSLISANYGYSEYEPGSLTASDGTTNDSSKTMINYLHGTLSDSESIATIFKDFQNSFNISDLKKLKAGNWCYSDNAYNGENKLLSSTEIFDKKVKSETIYYDSYIKLYGNYGYNPTLKCNGKVLNTFEDDNTNPTPMYVGAITSFEAVYSGHNFDTVYATTYLNQKCPVDFYWTMSPHLYNGNFDSSVQIYCSGGGGLKSMRIIQKRNIRPVISLLSNSTITTKTDISTYGQPGTINNPYVIN